MSSALSRAKRVSSSSRSWLCRSQFSSYEQAKAEAARLGIGIDAFSLNFGGTTAESNWSQWSDQMCQAQFSSISSNATFVNQVRIISPALMAVVKQCLEGQSVGLRAWIETSRDRSQVTVRARYVPIGAERAKIQGFAVTPASVTPSCSPAGTFANDKEFGPEGLAFTCAVDPTQNLTFTLNTTQGSASPRLDKFEPYTAPPPPTAVISANPVSLSRGQSTTLSWTTTNATSATISPNVGVSRQSTPAPGTSRLSQQQRIRSLPLGLAVRRSRQLQ